MRVAAALLILGLLLSAAPAVYAQGCAMCRASAQAAGPDGAKVMGQAILVLLVPTVSIFVGVVLYGLVFRRRSRLDEQAGEKFRAPLYPTSPEDFWSDRPHR
jgi:hypothetical protein